MNSGVEMEEVGSGNAETGENNKHKKYARLKCQ
jgi:hypothetical protein